MEYVLRVQNAHKQFGATQALCGANLAVNKGELLLLLGPNGAGKTTLVRAVAGRVRLDFGQVELFGNTLIPSDTSARGKLGVVPQEIALYPLLTARENLEVFGRLYGLAGSALQDRVLWALNWTGLQDRALSLVKTFSGGMQRRLNIACGVLHEPEVVLLDEPTVGVDPQSRERVWDMLAALRHKGTSLVLTTHQLDEAQTRCDRIVIIDHGKTIVDGSLNELIEQTIGMDREVILTLDGPLSAPIDNVALDSDKDVARTKVRDVAVELPALLQRIAEQDVKVNDIALETPSLHAVFLHLTGRELRE